MKKNHRRRSRKFGNCKKSNILSLSLFTIAMIEAYLLYKQNKQLQNITKSTGEFDNFLEMYHGN